MNASLPPRDAEWLEADGLGGFATGTVDGIRTRRYHTLLTHAATPPTGRMALVNGFEAWIERNGLRIDVSSQRYDSGVIHPDGASRISAFVSTPWPRWTFDLGDGARLEQELFVRHGLPLVALSWRLRGAKNGRLFVRPLLSGRDVHALHRANPVFRFDSVVEGPLRVWRPYPDVPATLSLAEADYQDAPVWYYQFLYERELERGFDAIEDLASPGVLSWDLSRGEAVWILAAETPETRELLEGASAVGIHRGLRAAERRRRAGFPTRLHRAAADYVVSRGKGRTIIAGYPWFTDWGRDTFIALRGLRLAGLRLADARSILLEWAGTVSEGMLPNRFVEGDAPPEFNSVDASLWYVIALHDWLEAMAAAGQSVTARDQRRLRGAVEAIVGGYARGTRFGIRQDDDGLLAAGEPGVQLTWMDSRVGERGITPRTGKPVEIQALWINALWIMSRLFPRWSGAYERPLGAFQERFWNPTNGCLYDVVDVDHQPMVNDASVRPNQILAIGGLPLAVLEGERARQVVDLVERDLWTPLGLRTLAPYEPEYLGRYQGGEGERDGAYHQGTVWPWLIGPFAEAWVRVRGGSEAAKREARDRFVAPLLAHLDSAGLGHVSEIADGDPPHRPDGAPFQAWSVGELLRLYTSVLAEVRRPAASPVSRPSPQPELVSTNGDG